MSKYQVRQRPTGDWVVDRLAADGKIRRWGVYAAKSEAQAAAETANLLDRRQP